MTERRQANNLSREEQKDIIKEAIREWLDEKYLAFGKWSLNGILAAGLAFIVYFLATHGLIK